MWRFLFLFLLVGSVLFAKTTEPFYLVVVTGYKDLAAYEEVVEFVKEALEDVGLKVELVEVPRKRGGQAVNSGEYDALPVRGIEDESDLPNIMTSSFPIAFTNFRVVSLNENRNWNEKNLKSYSGAMILNNASLQREMRRRGMSVIELSVSYADIAKMLLAKRIDYFVAPEELVASLKDRDPVLAKALKTSNEVFLKTPLYFSINKKHKDLMPKIEASLRKALADTSRKYKYIGESLNRNP